MANDPNELVTVYTVANPIEAEIIKNALVDEGIACVLDNELQAAEPGLMGLEIKVQVPVHQASRAREFIEAHERSQIRRAESDEE